MPRDKVSRRSPPSIGPSFVISCRPVASMLAPSWRSDLTSCVGAAASLRPLQQPAHRETLTWQTGRAMSQQRALDWPSLLRCCRHSRSHSCSLQWRCTARYGWVVIGALQECRCLACGITSCWTCLDSVLVEMRHQQLAHKQQASVQHMCRHPGGCCLVTCELMAGITIIIACRGAPEVS